MKCKTFLANVDFINILKQTLGNYHKQNWNATIMRRMLKLKTSAPTFKA